MKIDDVEYRVGVYTLLRSSEYTNSRAALSGLVPQLSSSVRLFVLLNDVDNSDIREHYSGLENVDFFCVNQNIGVAKGRNFLTNRAVEWGADILVSYDNDLICGSDYVFRVCTALHALSRSHRVGVVAPALLNASECGEIWADRYTEYWKNEKAVVLDEDAARRFVRKLDMTVVNPFYHLGIRNWRLHYLGSNVPPIDRLRCFASRHLKCVTPPMNRKLSALAHDPVVRKLVAGGEGVVGVDTLPGGAHCYFTHLLSDVGGFDEGFSPFGFEDSDFCIGAITRGYKNFLLPEVLVIHDIGFRNVNRGYELIAESRGRAKRIMIRKYNRSIWERLILTMGAMIFGTVEQFLHGMYLCRMKRAEKKRVVVACWRYLVTFMRS